MPPFSRNVEEEGVLLDNVKLVEDGRMLEAEMRRLLGAARYPARNPDQNIADLRAQVAANEKGVQELRRMVAHFGLDVVKAYMEHVQDNAEECVRRVIGVLKDGEFAYEMDNGAVIRVKIAIGADRRSAVIDFAGTSAQLESNFNAPSAVVYAAVLYVFRTLVDDDIPLNAGCLKPLEVRIPEGSMLNPRPPAATVAGNVETSQCITDALYGALGVMAASYGTMNNFTFGNATYQYYETISGGTGAGPGFPGTDTVQAHMTNSRLTDPEVLEWRYPGESGCSRDPRRQRRAREMERRQRRHAAHPLPGADDRRDPRRAPARAALRHGGRPAGRRWAATGSSAPTARAPTWASPTRPRWARATCSSSRRPAAAASVRRSTAR